MNQDPTAEDYLHDIHDLTKEQAEALAGVLEALDKQNQLLTEIRDLLRKQVTP